MSQPVSSDVRRGVVAAKAGVLLTCWEFRETISRRNCTLNDEPNTRAMAA